MKPKRDEEIRICITGWQREEALGSKADWQGIIDRRNNVYTVTQILHTFTDEIIKGCEVKVTGNNETIIITDENAFIRSIDEVLLDGQ